MSTMTAKRLHWVRQTDVTAPLARPAVGGASLDPRERLVAALADQPRTVAQLARTFSLSQPTMLEQVRRAVRDGLVVEVQVPEEERRFAAERYYAPAVPVIRGPDSELLASACRALADDVAVSLMSNLGDMHAAYAVTTLAREGWSFDDIWPYVSEMVNRLVTQRIDYHVRPPTLAPHGLAWVEDVPELEPASMAPEEDVA
ncbi:MAG TPA: winged helix-turn-helix domain-containing protein [Thermomicrobiales bacterium]|nr:winged helix-turn-helix domain-containing protein [Thermomicrobiales bacterium]